LKLTATTIQQRLNIFEANSSILRRHA
jgi:hypothetical protein